MELFQKYDVEFVFSTEKFDTSTPMGRAMLNICIVFAQLEREFDMYAKPETSYGDIARYFTDNNLDFGGKGLYRNTISVILHNPVYAQADLEIYEFFKSQGAAIVNDAADFSGTNGCYLYRGRDVAVRKMVSLKDQMLVIAPHEGIIPSETWLACRKKMLGNKSFSGAKKAKNTWLAGKIKCGRCGTSIVGAHNPDRVGYFRCRKRAELRACVGCGTLRILQVEQFIYDEMLKKMGEFQTLTGGNLLKANPKLTALNVELAQVEAGIEKLLDTLTGANTTLLAYANGKIEELDAKRQGLMNAIADITAKAVSPEQMQRISNHLNKKSLYADWC